ncbi:transglycosylase domain-containing protein [Flindersiella endophytica]
MTTPPYDPYDPDERPSYYRSRRSEPRRADPREPYQQQDYQGAGSHSARHAGGTYHDDERYDNRGYERGGHDQGGYDQRGYDQRYDDRYQDHRHQGGYQDQYDDRYDEHGQAGYAAYDEYDDEQGRYTYDPNDPEATAAYGPPGDRRRRKPKKKGRVLRRVLIGLLLTFLIGIIGGTAAFAIGYSMTTIPKQNDLVTSNATIVYYADGKTQLGTFAAQNRISVDLDKISDPAENAVLAAENQTFWTDNGVSPTGIVRAAWNDFAGGHKQGASTITQQYVKNFYLSPERTWERKVRELFITLKVQQQLSKQQILEGYLNTSYYGRGAYGIQTASQTYFGKDAKDLTPEEGAVLAAMLRAPSNYDPDYREGNLKRLDGRFRYALRGMEEMGKLEPGYAETAKLPKIKPRGNSEKFRGPRGYLLDQTKRELEKLGYDEKEIETGGLRVTTTFDIKAQRELEKAVKENSPAKKADGVRVGAASVRPATGEVVAMWGGPDYLKRQWNDATQSQIQPGSTFKPFALAAALEQGISLDSRFAGNSPYKLTGDKVNNEFNRDYGKYVSLRTAIEKSINTAFVDLTVSKLGDDKVDGDQKVMDAAIRAGVPKNSPGLEAIPKVSLGFASVRPVDMANSYATFAAGGQRAKWRVVDQVSDRHGTISYPTDDRPKPELEKAFDADVANNVNAALEQVVKKGTGRKYASKIGRPAAGKTGTHEDETAWFVGYTPQLSTAVAFYKDANSDGIKESLDWAGEMETFTGGGYPAKIWAAYMKGALNGQPKEAFPKPSKVGKAYNPKPKRTWTPDPNPTSPGPTPTGPDFPTPTQTTEPDPTWDPTQDPDPTPTETNDPDPTQDPWPTWPPGKNDQGVTGTPTPTRDSWWQ